MHDHIKICQHESTMLMKECLVMLKHKYKHQLLSVKGKLMNKI